ncbi:MAG: DUF951 domain-containing protein [Clostridia bacterium]
MLESFKLGDFVAMKKSHACGCNEWEIVRDGTDVKLKCCACSRIIMLDRCEFIKKACKNLSESKRGKNVEKR